MKHLKKCIKLIWNLQRGGEVLELEIKSLLCGKYTLFIQQYFLKPHNACHMLR